MNAKHRKVQVWIFAREGSARFFLLLKTRPERGSFWQPVTGSVESGEEPQEAALREMREETGLEPLSLRPISQAFEFESRGAWVEEHPFFAEIPAGAREQVRLDRHEHVQFEWAGAAQALAQLKFSSNADVLRDVIDFLDERNGKEER